MFFDWPDRIYLDISSNGSELIALLLMLREKWARVVAFLRNLQNKWFIFSAPHRQLHNERHQTVTGWIRTQKIIHETTRETLTQCKNVPYWKRMLIVPNVINGKSQKCPCNCLNECRLHNWPLSGACINAEYLWERLEFFELMLSLAIESVTGSTPTSSDFFAFFFFRWCFRFGFLQVAAFIEPFWNKQKHKLP